MSEVKLSDSDQNANIRMEKRDGETYIALGIFIMAVGLPVLLGTYWAYQAMAPGHVVAQNPAAGTAGQPGNVIDIVLSIGPEGTLLTTDITGLSQVAAEAALKADGFAVGEATQANDPKVAAGLVVSQDPAGGALADPGDKVNFVVSLGPKESVRLTSVIGMTQARAEEVLAADGFVIGNVTKAHSVPNVRGAVVNSLCGVVLILVALGSMGYGGILLARNKRRA
ncbi:MAG TPA: PASTA domain-containing protein [Candidatus Bathyarchaeia archaeon]|nr:PASTA domain-containing protein [Candidatus Bathyarchaeia archaeon]